MGTSYENCKENIVNIVEVFDKSGFVRHPDKSIFIPKQELVFPGFIINSKNITVSLTQERKLKLYQKCAVLIQIMEVACVQGLISSAFLGLQRAPLNFRHTDQCKSVNLKIKRVMLMHEW